LKDDFSTNLLLSLQVTEFWQVSAVADKPVRCTASGQMCCKQRWMLSVINLQQNWVDNACDGRRFRVIASYLSKVTNFDLPTCIWCLRWGWPHLSTHLSFAEIFSIRKLESLGYRVALFAWSYV